MSFQLFDYRGLDGTNEFKSWTQSLQSTERGKLDAKLDMLQLMGFRLLPEVLTGTDVPGVLKLRVKGKVQLRPMLCKGPINMESEFSLLIGAIEVGNKLKPANAPSVAADRKEVIRRDPDNRRVSHERVR